MKVSLMLVVLTVTECSSMAVVGKTGQNITLPCSYDIKYWGPLWVCWNRGQIPSRGCNDMLVSTDGVRVNRVTRISSRYQLLGQLERGDVSLTILNITEDDAGRYGCRVEIPGWFNDDKLHYDLSVVPPSPPAAEASQASEKKNGETTTNQEQSGPVTGDDTTEPMVAAVLSFPMTPGGAQPDMPLKTRSHWMFIGNTVRLSLIVSIPALMLTAAYRVRRLNPRSVGH